MAARTPQIIGGVALASGVTLGVASAVLVFAAVGDLVTESAALSPFATVGLVTGAISFALLSAGWMVAGHQY